MVISRVGIGVREEMGQTQCRRRMSKRRGLLASGNLFKGPQFVGFRSAKARPFAEARKRKATIFAGQQALGSLFSAPFCADDALIEGREEVAMRRSLPLLFVFLLAGCLPTVDETPQVGFDPFGKSTTAAPVQQRQGNYAPASGELSRRVDCIGRGLLAKNPQIGMKPLFATIGSPDVEIFHKDTSMVWVTAGLVQKCKAEADLAAVLSLELGKMVSEREALAPQKT